MGNGYGTTIFTSGMTMPGLRSRLRGPDWTPDPQGVGPTGPLVRIEGHTVLAEATFSVDDAGAPGPTGWRGPGIRGTFAGNGFPLPVPLRPMSTDPGEITALLGRWSQGDAEAFPRLVALAYDDLRAIAHRRLLATGGGGTLATTALVHEVFLRLVGRDGGEWPSRAHFYAFASRAMRHILVDHARRARAERRGGDQVRIPLEESAIGGTDGPADVLGVDDAVNHLAERHPRMAQVVEMRFFGGLTVPEVAEVLSTSIRTVEREWTRAKAYLLETLEGRDGPEGAEE